jgi:hypothetical protein
MKTNPAPNTINYINSISDQDKVNARITGILFITATVMAIIGLTLYNPIIHEADYLSAAANHSNQIVLGAVFELVLACANIGTGIMLFPHLQKVNQSLALGYALFRLLEVVFILIGLLSMLSIVSISHHYINHTGDLAALQISASILKTIHGWTFILGPHFMLGINTMIYSALFYKSGLVPKSLALLGITGALLILTASLLEMFSVISTFSIALVVLALPIAVYEMILAAWLIAKGFNYTKLANTHYTTRVNNLVRSFDHEKTSAGIL